MKLSKINLLNSILIALFLSVISAADVSAETTFFDQDDAFVMGSSPSDEIIEEITGRTAYRGGCRYEWNCTEWNECPHLENKPETALMRVPVLIYTTLRK